MMSKITHYHIYKNAGASLDTGLKAPLAKQLTREGAADILKPEVIKDFLDRNPHCAAVSTHLGRPRHRAHILPITLLRHPLLLRARSM